MSEDLWNLLNPLRNKWDICYMYRFLISFLFFCWCYISTQGQWTRRGLSLLLHHTGSAVLFSQALPVLFLQVSTWLMKRLHCSFAQFLTIPWGAVFTSCRRSTFYLSKRGVVASVLWGIDSYGTAFGVTCTTIPTFLHKYKLPKYMEQWPLHIRRLTKLENNKTYWSKNLQMMWNDFWVLCQCR